ncbi:MULTISPECIES: hypothetical protein [Photorhabdus]|uniref:Uncharacterized protein n=2 Tax=Photorhabdus TaxID=29487 RepID=A0A329VEB3_9GAMM|nr:MULTISPECIES: hypothetical protein [Photorhabdus]PQQ38427.1 hypothetical protein C6H68_07400 [Photorhabdus luminescens]RAW89820.1 hypothetical protein CKY01_14415 [Photorhabdus laumondii subsp. clarkei]RAX11924.1 hypothetical protein CKY02_12500 [Photorhabdus bodei]
MTNRVDIDSGRLIYTEDLGWIDLGHAKGDDSKMLWNQLVTESNNSSYKKGYFLVYYFQEMSKYNISTRVAAQWMVKKGLSIETKRSIAFSIMYCVSLEFETLQSNSFFSRFSDSGFSCEDLVSNLLGFYKSVLPRNYMSLIKPKNKEYAYKIWDYYGPVGKYKNRELRPWVFPDPDKYSNNAFPYKKNLPYYLNIIKPFSSYEKDIVISHYKPTTIYGLKL